MLDLTDKLLALNFPSKLVCTLLHLSIVFRYGLCSAELTLAPAWLSGFALSKDLGRSKILQS